jgi:hypothetical protein
MFAGQFININLQSIFFLTMLLVVPIFHFFSISLQAYIYLNCVDRVPPWFKLHACIRILLFDKRISFSKVTLVPCYPYSVQRTIASRELILEWKYTLFSYLLYRNTKYECMMPFCMHRQTSAGAVMLTDSVYWCIIFPALIIRHHQIDVVSTHIQFVSNFLMKNIH